MTTRAQSPGWVRLALVAVAVGVLGSSCAADARARTAERQLDACKEIKSEALRVECITKVAK